MVDQPDARYDYRPWNRVAPWASNEERLVSQALADQTNVSPAVLASLGPPLPRIVTFPPRFGYRTEALGIRDIKNIDIIYPGSRTDYSGMSSGRHGTSFPALGVA